MMPVELIREENELEPRMVIISIAVSSYLMCDDLPNAVKDAELIIDSLTDKYNIDKVVRLHEDAFDESRLIETFAGLREYLDEMDSILVMYNGHGEVDNNNLLYWVPRNGILNQTNTLYLATKVFAEVKNLNVEHSVIVVNCCESGRMINQEIDRDKSYTQTNNVSRILFTSGRVSQDVFDSINNSKNSPFAEAFDKYLRESNSESVTFTELAAFVTAQLHEKSSYHRPTLSFWGGHQGGDLNFYLKKDENQYWNEAKMLDSVESYEKYLSSFRKGHHLKDARMRYEQLKNERNSWIEALKKIEAILNDFSANFKGVNGKFFGDLNLFTNSITEKIEKLTKEEDLTKKWTKISNSNIIEEFIQFDIEFPNSKYEVESREIQIKLKKALKAKKDWELIKKQGRPGTYRAKLITYLKDHPSSEYTNEANLRIFDIEEFVEAKDENDIVKLAKYADKERAIYKAEAKALITAIKIENRYQEFQERMKTAIQDRKYYEIFRIKIEIESFEYYESQRIKDLYNSLIETIKSYETLMQEDFDKAMKEPNLSLLFNFVDDYKEGDLVEKALIAFKDNEMVQYDIAKALDTIESFDSFVTEFKCFKNSDKIRLDFFDIALQRLQDLKQDKLVFDNSNTILELENYVNRVKKGALTGKYLTDAILKIETIKIGIDRKLMYEQITKEPTLELCEKFISNYSEIKDQVFHEVAAIFTRLKRNEKKTLQFNAILNETDLTRRIKMSNAFILRYSEDSDFEHVDKIKAIISRSIIEQNDISRFNSANSTETLHGRQEALEEYIQDENSIFKDDANQVLESLLEKIRTDQAEFDQAISCENIEEKINLLSFYLAKEDCIKKEEAQAIMDALIIEKQDIDDFDYTKIQDDNIEAWERFIAKSIQSERKDDAINRRDKLMAQREEENSYELLKTSPSKLACYAYIEKYGRNGKFVNEVEHILNQILNDESLIKTSNLDRFETFMDKNFKSMGKKVFSIEVILLGVVILLLLFMLLLMTLN